MVKLVVADDEERVCRLIVALGNWEELGIKQIYQILLPIGLALGIGIGFIGSMMTTRKHLRV